MYTYVDAPCTLFVVAIFGASTRMNDMAKKYYTNGSVIFLILTLCCFCVNNRCFHCCAANAVGEEFLQNVEAECVIRDWVKR